MMLNDPSIIAGAQHVPHLNQWFGYWHYEPQRAAALSDTLRGMDVAAHVRGWQAKQSDDGEGTGGLLVRSGGIGIVSLAGSLMKHLSSMDNGTSTVLARTAVRTLIRDDTISAAIINVDSPGGTVAGAYELADDIRRLAAAKPTYGFAEDLAASAGYLQLSQTRSISANRTALVGCIGTLGVMYDQSAAFEKDGVKPIVISSGGFKGAGVPGTKITDEQIAEWQREIDGLNQQFIKAVTAGRRIPQSTAKRLADGRTFIADEARSLGLIDRVESFDDLFIRVQREIDAPAGGRSTSPGQQTAVGGAAKIEDIDMATENPATIAELKQAFPDNPAFALDCAEASMTLGQAKIKAFDEKLQPEQPAKRSVGVQAVPSGRAAKPDGDDEGYSGNAIADFDAAVRKEMSLTKGDRRKATRNVMRRDPELHRAYLEATNAKAGKRVQRLIADKFDDR